MSESVKRVEELTLALLDGNADAEGREELSRLVAEDPEARRIHLSLIEIESSLRGRTPVSSVIEVMARIQRERTERAVRSVMKQVSSMTPVIRGPRAQPVRPHRIAIVTGLLAGAVIGAGFLLVRAAGPRPETAATRPVPPPAPVAARPVAEPAPAPVPVSGPDPVVVLSHDFENNGLSELFIDGQVVSDDCAGGSRHCALGTMSPYDPAHATVTVERHRPPLLTYAPNMVLSFDYRVGSDTHEIRVQLWSPARKENFAIFLDDRVTDQWGHAEVRLSDLRSYKNRNRLAPGDELGNVMITAGLLGGAPFHVDNLRVLAYPPDADLPPSTAASPVSP